MSSLNLEQIKDYKDNGFVAPINVLSLEEVKKIMKKYLVELLQRIFLLKK